MDTLTPSERSARMRLVKNKDTRPELVVRQLTYALGFRYRLHVKTVPGRPDLVFSGRRKVIFVHGCFWHRHPGCSLARLPKSRLEFWLPKLERNRERDCETLKGLAEQGWKVLVIWECELGHREVLRTRIKKFLEESEKWNEGG
ncbi:very short patch repair endonuclease [Massilia sp. TWR1-2-2]|uniref:very short patch repair endonuclease n=1 Tax=Massilia sp. TWR1-2-2 TaxID=2804584 RepID=UPI003CEE1F4E